MYLYIIFNVLMLIIQSIYLILVNYENKMINLNISIRISFVSVVAKGLNIYKKNGYKN